MEKTKKNWNFVSFHQRTGQLSAAGQHNWQFVASAVALFVAVVVGHGAKVKLPGRQEPFSLIILITRSLLRLARHVKVFCSPHAAIKSSRWLRHIP